MADKKICKGFPSGYKCENKPVPTEEFCATCKGRKFEANVADLFSLLGFDVNKDELVSGSQTDLIVHFRQGKLGYSSIVECKDQKDPVGNADVERFWGRVASSKFIKGYFVSRNGFTASAKTFSENKKEISLLTYTELVNSLADFDEYIERLIHDYENFGEYAQGERLPIIENMSRCDLYKYYVPLCCYGEETPSQPIADFLEEWSAESKRNYLAILGDYGTGKSSFCLQTTYALAKSYRTDPVGNRIPILVPLREYNKAVDIRQLVTNLLINQYKVKIASYEAFEKLLDNGRVILLLDGFDEMATRVDKKVTLSNFRELAKLARPASKTILTCRTHYFKTQTEAAGLLSRRSDTELMAEIRQRRGFEITFMREFDTGQIETFLQKHTPDWQSLLKRIHSTYNLEDLARRPVLLDIIVKTLPRMDATYKTINSASLYETYTGFWIEHEDWRSNMSCEEKAFFTTELAYQMLREGKESVHYSSLASPIKEHFKDKVQSHQDLDYFDNDVRTCSFLNRDAAGNYQFIHKSFMEYFVARKICGVAVKDIPATLKPIRLTEEICYFLKQTGLPKKPLLQILTSHRKARNKTETSDGQVANAVSILVAQGHDFSGYDFSGFNLEGSIMKEGKFQEAQFEESNLTRALAQGANMTRATFHKANLVETDFSHSLLNKARFKGLATTKVLFNRANLEEVHIEDVRCDEGSFEGAILNGSTILGSKFEKCRFRRCRLRGAQIGKSNFIKCSMAGTKINKASLEETNLEETKLTGADLSECKLKDCQIAHISFNLVNLDYCALEGVQLSDVRCIERVRGKLKLQLSQVRGLSKEEISFLMRTEGEKNI